MDEAGGCGWASFHSFCQLTAFFQATQQEYTVTMASEIHAQIDLEGWVIPVGPQPQPDMEHVDTHSGVYCCGEAMTTHSHLCMKTIDDMVWQEHIYQDSAVRMSYHLGQWYVRKVVHMGYWNTHIHGCNWMLGYCWKQI